jgi:hypothetical protein
MTSMKMVATQVAARVNPRGAAKRLMAHTPVTAWLAKAGHMKVVMTEQRLERIRREASEERPGHDWEDRYLA